MPASFADSLRHYQTKGAGTDVFYLKRPAASRLYHEQPKGDCHFVTEKFAPSLICLASVVARFDFMAMLWAFLFG